MSSPTESRSVKRPSKPISFFCAPPPLFPGCFGRCVIISCNGAAAGLRTVPGQVKLKMICVCGRPAAADSWRGNNLRKLFLLPASTILNTTIDFNTCAITQQLSSDHKAHALVTHLLFNSVAFTAVIATISAERTYST